MSPLGEEDHSHDAVVVRDLRPEDLDWVVAIDRQSSGEARVEYFRLKLREARDDTGLRISLAAIVEGVPCGFVMGRLYYGEFGAPEQAAILDSIGVSTHQRGHGVAAALIAQLRTNLAGLGIDRIETQVSWDQFELLAFFRSQGFRPSDRLCLELPLGRR